MEGRVIREGWMDIVGVVYMSRSTQLMSPRDTDRLLMDARSHNAARGITGVLLYGGGQFFQYFEGQPVDVEYVYKRIRHSSLHTGLVELERPQLSQRLFRQWFMGFREAPASVIQGLSQEQWNREIPNAEERVFTSPGMHQLTAFLGPVAD
jgi:hypothetical protein